MTSENKVPALASLSQIVKQAVDTRLALALASFAGEDAHLKAAMHYSLTNGGKRVRPLLVYASAQAINANVTQGLDWIGAALEAIHAYSLVHDDLPAMDDDDLRRGKPTTHIAYNEATAILAGDALQAMAFELLAQAPLATELKLELIALLARASGAKGMVLGQAIDLAAVNKTLNITQLEHMHRHKTGALISAAVHMGALAAGAGAAQLATLANYASAIGLAFQVQDDILDVTSDTQTLGKQQGADSSHNKPTYVSLLGLEGARAKARDLHADAHQALKVLGTEASALGLLADYIVERNT